MQISKYNSFRVTNTHAYNLCTKTSRRGQDVRGCLFVRSMKDPKVFKLGIGNDLGIY